MLFEKLAKYIGDNTERLLTRSDGKYVFRVIKNKIFYLSDEILRYCPHVKAEQLCGAGI